MNPLGAALSEGVRFCASKETSDRFPFATFIICFCAEKSIHTQKVHNCVKFIIVLLQSASSSPLTGQPPDMRCRALQFSRNAATKKRSRRGRTAKLHLKINQRLENWGARRAAFRPYFLRSFIRGSRVRKPAFVSTARFSSLCCSRARLRP